jgi:hypothetical protein
MTGYWTKKTVIGLTPRGRRTHESNLEQAQLLCYFIRVGEGDVVEFGK